MKNFSIFTISAFVMMLVCSCSSNQLTGVWVNKEKMEQKSYKKIFVLAQTADIQARKAVEDALVAKAKDRGFELVSSISIMPPSLSNPEIPSKESVIEGVKSSGCDAAFIVTMLKKEENVRYTPGTTVYAPLPYYRWNSNMFNYYDYWRPSVSTPGYYSNNHSYFLQSNLYDAASQELMVSIQSELFNPESLQKFAKDYVNDVVSKLQKEGLLKK
jgi:hypothetical protein